MPLNVEFNYPVPVEVPRPVKAVLEGSLNVNLETNAVTASYVEYLQPVDANGAPRTTGAPTRASERKTLRIFLSNAQLQQILDIISTEAGVQGALVSGSSPIITSK